MAWNFAAKPPGWVEITSTKRMHTFYVGDTISFTLSATSASTYEVRNYYGSVVDSGAANVTSITLPVLPCGWYKLYLTGTTADATYGTALGEAYFCVIRSDTRFVPNPAPGTPGRAAGFVHEGVVRGMFVMGPQRHYIRDAADPTADNGSGDGMISSVQANADIDKTYYTASGYLDPARPRKLLCQFPNGTTAAGQPEGVTQTVAALYPDVEYFEGPSNEPQGIAPATVAAQMETFYNAVKAGHPNAQVLGPNPVDINSTSSPWLDDFFAAGGGQWCDAISVHVYNSFNGDISLGRKCLKEFERILIKHGQQNKPRWQTEQGAFAAVYGSFQPRLQARWTMIQLLMQEQYKIPKEQNNYWYDESHGFWDFPAFWEASSQHLFPGAVLHRTWSEELFGKTHTSAYDFGAEGNDAYLGSLFTDAVSGDKVAAFLTGGMIDGQIKLSIAGAGSVMIVDAWGNETTQTVVGGIVSVTVDALPVYVRLPSGVAATLQTGVYGRDLAAAATNGTTISASNPGDGIKLKRVISEGHTKQEISEGHTSSYYYNNSDPAHAQFPFNDTTLPAWIRIDWPNAQRIDRVRVFAAPPWQSQGTLLDFDIQTLDSDGVTWTTRVTVTEPTLTFKRTAHQSTTACTVDSYFSDRWIFDESLGGVVTTKAIRVYVRDCTYGGGATQDVVDAGGQAGAKRLVIREIQAFSEDSMKKRFVVRQA